MLLPSDYFGPLPGNLIIGRYICVVCVRYWVNENAQGIIVNRSRV